MDDLVGLTFEKIDVSQDKIRFTTEDDVVYVMYHDQDCCESVYVESIVGDIQDLIGSPILRASEDSSSNMAPPEPEYADESHTWTFYKLATIKGYVDIRWFGTSNGYYSESVTISKLAQ